jgi:hypothetical protein
MVPHVQIQIRRHADWIFEFVQRSSKNKHFYRQLATQRIVKKKKPSDLDRNLIMNAHGLFIMIDPPYLGH